MRKTITTEHANRIKRERSEIRTRNGSLMYLLFGTAISSALIGIKIAGQFNLSPIPSGAMIGFCIVFGYFSVDAAVRNNLIGASDGTAKKEMQDYFNKKSITALISTVLFSVAASYFVGQFSKGKNPYEDFEKNILAFSKQDSTNKQLAAATLFDLKKEEVKNISNLKKAAQQAEKNLINNFEGKPISKSWKEDYRRGKTNPRHYIWICKTCPRKYRRWRNAIQAVRSNLNQDLQSVGKTNNEIKKGLSTTLAYQMQADTTIKMLSNNTIQRANERERNSLIFTMILVLLTVAAAFGAYSSNNNIKRLRAEYGQMVEEGDDLIFDVIEDFISKLTAQFLSLIFGVLIAIDKGLEKIGIDLYEIEGKAIAKFSTNHPTNQGDQAEQIPPRVVINGFGQNKPDQPQTLGGQQLPTDRPIARPIGQSVDQPPARPIGQSFDQVATSPTKAPEKIIEKQTKLIINNVNITAIKRACKRSFLRSFFPSNDSQYLKRNINNPPAPGTLQRNKKLHLEKVEELKVLGLNVRYIGEGKDRTLEFI